MKEAKDITPDTIFMIMPVSAQFRPEKEKVLEIQKRIESTGQKTVIFFDLFSPQTDADYPSERIHLRKSLPYVVMCDRVITFPRWETCLIATHEVRIAQVLQTKIIPVDKFLLDLEKNQVG